MFSKIVFSVFVVVSWATPSWAAIEYLRLGRGHVVAYEYLPGQKTALTIVLLPGVNRALTSEDPSVQALNKAGWGVLLPSLAAHPRSIQGLKENEGPYFIGDSNLRVDSFARDIEQLASYLQVSNLVAVSLSYSSSIAADLDPVLFPKIIHTVPMIEANEGNPEAAAQAALWESWFALNPFLAPFWIRSFRDQNYSLYWSQIVEGNLRASPEIYGPEPRISDIKQGYVTITRAAEDFDLRNISPSKEPQQIDYIFAGQEDPNRMRNQLEVIKNQLKTGQSLRVVVVMNSGHVLPSDQPIIYAGAIAKLASEAISVGEVKFAEVSTESQAFNPNWKGRKALENWIKRQEDSL